MAEAAIAQHKREQLARKVAAEAVREARTSRVSQLANLIAASLEMVKKSATRSIRWCSSSWTTSSRTPRSR